MNPFFDQLINATIDLSAPPTEAELQLIKQRMISSLTKRPYLSDFGFLSFVLIAVGCLYAATTYGRPVLFVTLASMCFVGALFCAYRSIAQRREAVVDINRLFTPAEDSSYVEILEQCLRHKVLLHYYAGLSDLDRPILKIEAQRFLLFDIEQKVRGLLDEGARRTAEDDRRGLAARVELKNIAERACASH